MSVCPSCGHDNQEGAKFCSECATPLETGGTTAREERKIVTVLFADLVGFTAQAERLDPEDVRALLAPYHARLRAELERFGGTVEKFIGDAVMALFGAPVAHEDDPERAVRAALAIRDWVLEDDELQLRIAVNTGEALVALGAQPSAGEGMASGDVVNVAARLQAAAPVNGILVGETTYRATRDVIDYQVANAVEAKGKAQPIPVWEAVAPRSALGVDVVQAGRTPLIGRAQELTLLLDTAERVRTAREPQLITLVGVPGIGKSRLTFELFNALTQDDGVRWRQGRCLPYGEGVAFWAIGEIVKSHAEIFESDPAPRAEQKLRHAVSAVVTDEHEADRMIRAFRPLVGLTTETTFGRERQTEAFAAWRHFFEVLAERDPLVLVLEDLHWGDDQLLDFVDELIDWAADVPLLVLCTARPELLERRPDWGGGKLNASTLSLRPLSHDDTARVLAANLQRPMLEAELQTALLERAGGNPLYAEQYARMLAERSDASELPLPETVQAIVASRLDGLAVEDKEFLHDAAVHGKVFWAGAVAAMTGREPGEVERRLHALERKEFLRRERRSAVAGETQYVFRHMLVRDVAYGQIPRRLRAEKHRLAAEWIASLGEHREDHVELLADHYERALEYAEASGSDKTGLVEPARFAFRAAGERADKLGAWTAAVRFFRSALDLWPPDEEERPRLLLQLAESLAVLDEGGVEEATEARNDFLARGDVEYAARAEATLGDIAFNRGQGEEARAHSDRALELTRGLPASETKAIVLLNATWRDFLTGEAERALATAEEARAITEEIRAGPLLVWALQLVGGSRIELGDHGGVDDMERAVALGHEIDAPQRIPVALNLAVTLIELGRMSRASELIAEARAESSRLGHLPSLTWADVLRMRKRYYNGDWDGALRLANQTLKTEGEYVRHFRTRTVRSQIYLARGRVREALADANDAVVIGRSIGDHQSLHSALAVNAHANLAAGARGAAIEAFDEVLERIAAEGSQQLSAFLPDLVATAVELDRAEPLQRAIMALRKQTPWIDAGVSFLMGDYLAAAAQYNEIGTRPDAAYANLRAARFLLDTRRREEAEQALGEALAFFRAVGATRYVAEGEALLAVSA